MWTRHSHTWRRSGTRQRDDQQASDHTDAPDREPARVALTTSATSLPEVRQERRLVQGRWRCPRCGTRWTSPGQEGRWVDRNRASPGQACCAGAGAGAGLSRSAVVPRQSGEPDSRPADSRALVLRALGGTSPSCCGCALPLPQHLHMGTRLGFGRRQMMPSASTRATRPGCVRTTRETSTGRGSGGLPLCNSTVARRRPFWPTGRHVPCPGARRTCLSTGRCVGRTPRSAPRHRLQGAVHLVVRAFDLELARRGSSASAGAGPGGSRRPRPAQARRAESAGTPSQDHDGGC